MKLLYAYARRPEDPHTFLGDYIKAHREAT